MLACKKMNVSFFFLLLIWPSFMTVYYTKVTTSDKPNAGTDADIYIKIHGDTGVTTKLLLDDPDRDDFEKGAWV